MDCSELSFQDLGIVPYGVELLPAAGGKFCGLGIENDVFHADFDRKSPPEPFFLPPSAPDSLPIPALKPLKNCLFLLLPLKNCSGAKPST